MSDDKQARTRKEREGEDRSSEESTRGSWRKEIGAIIPLSDDPPPPFFPSLEKSSLLSKVIDMEERGGRGGRSS
jgi:hypothetical protein